MKLQDNQVRRVLNRIYHLAIDQVCIQVSNLVCEQVKNEVHNSIHFRIREKTNALVYDQIYEITE